MHARTLHVLHNARNQHVFAVANRVDLHLRAHQVMVHQHWVFVRRLHRAFHVVAQLLLVVHNFHRAATQHVTRAHHARVRHVRRRLHGVFRVRHAMPFRARNITAGQQLIEALAVLRTVNAVHTAAQNLDATFMQRPGQIDGRLPAKLHDDAQRLFLVQYVQHVFYSQRLKVQPVRRVKIRGHGFGVAVDDDGLKSEFLQ